MAKAPHGSLDHHVKTLVLLWTKTEAGREEGRFSLQWHFFGEELRGCVRSNQNDVKTGLRSGFLPLCTQPLI
jgi:hypothetical protein